MTERTEEHNKAFQDAYEAMASKGHRVLAFAYLPLPADIYPDDFAFSKDPANYPNSGFCFLGLVSLEDPPKHGVREAIGRCRQAGIKVMMVTGDHPLTAEAIARKINLMLKDTRPKVAKRLGKKVEEIHSYEYDAVVVHGEQIDTLTDDEWDEILIKDEIIFARTSPAHKLEIVKRCQSLGHIVGVTGDGVNDSPALKKADLGIAMNISGSDVSKEAATMILLDDNFASTVAGIEEGRLIFQNLRKSVQYTICHTLPEVVACLLNVAIPLPLPLSALLIIFIDLGFELFMALSFAWEKPESDTGLLLLPPRKPVTPQSIARLRALEASQQVSQPERRLESGGSGPSVHTGFGKYFTRGYWNQRFSSQPGEVLVDAAALSYAYLEIGLISTIGCHVTYFITLWHLGGISPADARHYSQDSRYFTREAPVLTTTSGNVLVSFFNSATCCALIGFSLCLEC
jgi:sodium/potassium-transporting ATPase subunit alpha